ncbi:MAG TPA: hypothetical protein VN844_09335 [Pyrinomonadaceae bacterium]|nr:hypothetical protein [Pyrinomonadaceae bacterium]
MFVPVVTTSNGWPEEERRNRASAQQSTSMFTKRARYRETIAVLASHGIGIVGDQLIRHEAGNRAHAQHLCRACEDLMMLNIGGLFETGTQRTTTPVL